MRKNLLYAATAITALAVAMAPLAAHATPYAFASNNITGLTITFAGGAPLTNVTSATTNISDSAQFGVFGISGFQNVGLVGNALTINQAYSGPGPAPSAGITPVGPGNFTGTRANAAIGAGSAATGGVTVQNVAEGFWKPRWATRPPTTVRRLHSQLWEPVKRSKRSLQPRSIWSPRPQAPLMSQRLPGSPTVFRLPRRDRPHP